MFSSRHCPTTRPVSQRCAVQRAVLLRRAAAPSSASLSSRRDVVLGLLFLPAGAAIALEEENAATTKIAFQDGPVGLQYSDVVIGNGEALTAGDLVTVSYVGTLQDGQRFDAAKRFQFAVGQKEVIQGWDLALLGDASSGLSGMRIGGKRVVKIAPKLAYGKAGAGCRGLGGDCVIPPNAELTFVIEILGVRKPKK